MARGKEASLKERYAAALLHLEAARCTIDPTLQACIDREKAKQMSPEQIIGHFDVDHYPVPKALGGSNHPTNLNPIPRGGHKKKTAKKDIPVIAKVRRSVKEQKFVVKKNETRDEMVDRLWNEKPKQELKKKWPKRKMQSRGFSPSSGRMPK